MTSSELHGDLSRCEHPGCKNPGMECRSPEWDAEQILPEFYCPGHAVEHGFCFVCGEYNAGLDGFDILHIGYCDHCWDEVINDQFDDEDFDEAGWIDELEDDDA